MEQAILCATPPPKIGGGVLDQAEKGKFLITHPAPNLLIVYSCSKSKLSPQVTLPDCEGLKVDGMACMVCSCALMLARIHSYVSYMGTYNYRLIQKIMPALPSLSQDLQGEEVVAADVIASVSQQQVGALKDTVGSPLACWLWLYTIIHGLQPTSLQEDVKAIPLIVGLLHSSTMRP